MRFTKPLATWVICLSLFFLAPMSFAQTEYILVSGSRAVIMEKQVVLISSDGKKSVAPPGSYETRDGRYTIIVRKDKVVVRDHTQELR